MVAGVDIAAGARWLPVSPVRILEGDWVDLASAGKKLQDNNCLGNIAGASK